MLRPTHWVQSMKSPNLHADVSNKAMQKNVKYPPDHPHIWTGATFRPEALISDQTSKPKGSQVLTSTPQTSCQKHQLHVMAALGFELCARSYEGSVTTRSAPVINPGASSLSHRCMLGSSFRARRHAQRHIQTAAIFDFLKRVQPGSLVKTTKSVQLGPHQVIPS